MTLNSAYLSFFPHFSPLGGSIAPWGSYWALINQLCPSLTTTCQPCSNLLPNDIKEFNGVKNKMLMKTLILLFLGQKKPVDLVV